MVHEVKEAIVQLLHSIVSVAHTGVDAEAAKKLQTFSAKLCWQRLRPETPEQARGGVPDLPIGIVKTRQRVDGNSGSEPCGIL